MIMYFSKPTQGDRSSKTTCHRQRVHEQGGIHSSAKESGRSLK